MLACDSSNGLYEKMIYHKIHIYGLCGLHELYECVSSKILFFQSPCFRKIFTTRFTFVISVALMNCANVHVQISCFKKWFTTRITFVIFVAFMNCKNVSLQRFCLRKWFNTVFTVKKREEWEKTKWQIPDGFLDSKKYRKFWSFLLEQWH